MNKVLEEVLKKARHEESVVEGAKAMVDMNAGLGPARSDPHYIRTVFGMVYGSCRNVDYSLQDVAEIIENQKSIKDYVEVCARALLALYIDKNNLSKIPEGIYPRLELPKVDLDKAAPDEISRVWAEKEIPDFLKDLYKRDKSFEELARRLKTKNPIIIIRNKGNKYNPNYVMKVQAPEDRDNLEELIQNIPR